ncbi:MAG: pitrilysin family protein [Gammaproteobacteria bacterium]|nr:pitrilysin family protein [Gammaproteobacteria bacterium]MDE0442709.1 pitrilysin family protein [Gammaproteobacteria bacterium]
MRSIKPFAAFVLATLVAAYATAIAAEEQTAVEASATKVASVEGITEYQLDNGLKFLLFPDQSKQQITVNITYLVGSRHEGYGETGMAHLLEHLVFKGTPNHPNIPAELTERGASPNGTTWFDRTNYFETFPATEDNLEWALDLESDRMINSFIAAEDLESEMTVVRNEWERGENNPGAVLQKRLMSTAYQWHNYGNSTIGARADIENVPIDRLQAFYRKYYQPDNAVLVIGGKFDPERAIELVEEKFGPIPRPERTGANQLFPTYTAEPAQDGERSVTLRRVGDVQLAMAAYHVPAGAHEDFAALDVMAYVLSTQPAGRLYKNVVEPGLAAGAGAFAFQLHDPGVLLANVQVRKEDDLTAATDAMLDTLHGLVDEPPTEEEVERAKANFAANFELAFNNPNSIARQISEWASMGDWRLMFLHRDRLEKVTPEDVVAVAEKYLKPSNRTIGYYYPTDATPPRAQIDPTPDVAALVGDYKGREAISAGEVFEPTPENIAARTTILTLSNGVEVALLPKENRGDAVTASFTFRHGTEASLDGWDTAAALAGSMLMRGTAKRSRQEITDELIRLKVAGGVSGGVLSVGGSATTVRENLPDAIRLAAEVLREPSFPGEEFELLREQNLAGMESQRSDPQALASNALNRHVNAAYGKGHVFYSPTFDEQIERYKEVNVEQAKEFWASFYGAEGGTISIVGDFDPDEIVPVLEKAFGDWEAKEEYARVDRPYVEVPAKILDIETPDKTNAVMFAFQRIQMRDDHPDYPAMVIGNYMLGGGFLNSRLATRIRQQDGLSYGVGSQFGANAIDEVGTFNGYAIFAPENGDKVVAAFKEEVAKVLENGFTDEEVDAAKRGWLDAVQRQRSSDSTVASILNSNLFLDRDMSFIAKREAAVAALTAEDINAAFKRHVDLDNMSFFRGGDFANKLPK